MNNVNAGPDNAEVARGIGSDMAWGATFGAVSGGPVGAMVGAGCAAVQNVVQGAVKHGPVAVTMPTVPMGPTPFMSGAPPTINGMSIDEFLKKHKALN
ncbi:hypothetical protein ACL2XQ_00985 [Sodalis sp. RH14]|uniref:E492 group microcin n=1 Tax=Sodalis sp. RH14 TaxID=3394329 RepID=UPI0039B6A34A